MLRNIIVPVALLGAIAACDPVPDYSPREVKMDVRTAQEQVRVLLTNAPHVTWEHGESGITVSDVKFREDGMALLLDNDGVQSVQVCYYAGIQNLNAYEFGPLDRWRYKVWYFCRAERGIAMLNTMAEAHRLVDAIFALKNARR